MRLRCAFFDHKCSSPHERIFCFNLPFSIFKTFPTQILRIYLERRSSSKLLEQNLQLRQAKTLFSTASISGLSDILILLFPSHNKSPGGHRWERRRREVEHDSALLQGHVHKGLQEDDWSGLSGEDHGVSLYFPPSFSFCIILFIIHARGDSGKRPLY